MIQQAAIPGPLLIAAFGFTSLQFCRSDFGDDLLRWGRPTPASDFRRGLHPEDLRQSKPVPGRAATLGNPPGGLQSNKDAAVQV
jgi:hypothetical protein